MRGHFVAQLVSSKVFKFVAELKAMLQVKSEQ